MTGDDVTTGGAYILVPAPAPGRYEGLHLARDRRLQPRARPQLAHRHHNYSF